MATTEKYIPAIGRRKTATARIRITKGEKGFMVNNKDVKDYFKTTELIRVASESLNTAQDIADYGITVIVRGGGIAGQAVAVRHGIARALTEAHEHVKTDLKKAGFLKRDPRSKERRKFGFRKARKRPQWSKR
jgi:small subunit ribosomal protein S9